MRDKRLIDRVARHLKRSNYEVSTHLEALLKQLGDIFEDNSDAFKLVQKQLFKDIDKAYDAMLFLVIHEDVETFKLVENAER